MKKRLLKIQISKGKLYFFFKQNLTKSGIPNFFFLIAENNLDYVRYSKRVSDENRAIKVKSDFGVLTMGKWYSGILHHRIYNFQIPCYFD